VDSSSPHTTTKNNQHQVVDEHLRGVLAAAANAHAPLEAVPDLERRALRGEGW
jgi:hypothetical protein